MMLPMPGNDASSFSLARQAGEPRTMVSISLSMSASSFSSAARCRAMLLRSRRRRAFLRCRSATIISMICRPGRPVRRAAGPPHRAADGLGLTLRRSGQSPPHRSDRSWRACQAPGRSARTWAGLTTASGSAGPRNRGRHDGLEAAGRLHRDQPAPAPQRSTSRPNLCRRARRQRFPRWPDTHVQPILRYIDANIDRVHLTLLAQSGSHCGPSDCSGSMERRRGSRAEVRASKP